jgi:hypothetical protein
MLAGGSSVADQLSDTHVVIACETLSGVTAEHKD